MSISFFQLSNRSPANGRASLLIKIAPDDSDDSIDRVHVQARLPVHYLSITAAKEGAKEGGTE